MLEGHIHTRFTLQRRTAASSYQINRSVLFQLRRYYTTSCSIQHTFSSCIDTPSRVPAYTNLGRSTGASRESIRDGTQLVSSVQSAWSPQLQPVEKREKSQVSFLPGRKQVHFF